MAKTKTNTQPLKAWVVDTGQELKVVFAGSYDDVLAHVGGDPMIQRDKRYDQFREDGEVPLEVLLRDGWAAYCSKCGKQVDRHAVEDGQARIENDRAVCSGCLCIGDNSFDKIESGNITDDIPGRSESVQDDTNDTTHVELDTITDADEKDKIFSCTSKPPRIYGDGICPEHPAGKGNCKGCTFWKETAVKKQGLDVQDVQVEAKELNYFDPITTRTYFVRQGWGESPNWIVLYRTGDGAGTHRLKSLKAQDTREKAQAQLDDYAQKRGWEARQSEEELAKSKCTTTFDGEKCVGCVSWLKCYQSHCLKKLSPFQKMQEQVAGLNQDEGLFTEDIAGAGYSDLITEEMAPGSYSLPSSAPDWPADCESCRPIEGESAVICGPDCPNFYTFPDPAANQELDELEKSPDVQVNIARAEGDIEDFIAGPGQGEFPELSASDRGAPEDPNPAPTKEALSSTDVFQKIEIGHVYPNPANPRKTYDEADMAELIESVREVGILEPLLVVPDENDSDRYRIVAGERRYRAGLAAELHELPAIIKHLTPDQEFTVMLSENLKRKDLSPLEEAQAFAEARARGWKEEELAHKLGISQSQVSNRLRLLKLPDPIKELISHEILSAGHGLALLKVAGAPKFAEKLAASISKARVPVNDADKHVEDYVAMNGRPLFKTYSNSPLFDPDKFCGKCRSRVLARSYPHDGEHKHPFCIDHACWDKHQEDAQLQKAEELRRRIDKHAEEVDGAAGDKEPAVVDLQKLQYGDEYKIFHEGQLVDPDDCAGCEFIKPTVGGYNGPALACFKPHCFKEKMKKAESLKNREERRQKRDFEQVKGELIDKGLFNEDGQVRKEVLAYMAAEAAEYGPSSSLWTRAKIKAELWRMFGWERDESKSWEHQQADLIRNISALDETGLWRVLLFCLLTPAEHNSLAYQLTLGAKQEAVDLEEADAS